MTKIMMVSGSWPPDSCGVGHYSSKLADHLEGSVEVVRFRGEGGIGTLPSVLREISRVQPDLIHVQYPTMGYRRSLMPSIITVLPKIPTVATLHEYSIFRWYRAPWFIPFKFANAVIFTNSGEEAAFENRFGAAGNHTCVIPIGSNIPVGRSVQRASRSICYFGLLMPGKGLEDFLSLAELLKDGHYQSVIIGAIPDGFHLYAKNILERCSELGVSTYLNRSDDEVADLMQGITYAYFSFPDGASDKRGSLIAALANGIIALTTHKARTPDWIKARTIGAASPAEALQILNKLSTSADGGRSLIDGDRARPTLNWSEIASRHVALYRSLLNR